MGKVRNARRRPWVTAAELEGAQSGDGCVEHQGRIMEVIYNGSRSRPYILRSDQGVKYAARVMRDGSVSVDLLGLS